MKVGTDFSGIGAPEMALKYLNIDFESVFACEIDKYARQSFMQLHHPKKFYNDITTRNHKDIEQLDLYVAGFPCQSFSMAGKRKGFDEARGTLFFNVADFIKINQPKVFVLENVKGLLSHDKGKTFQTIVDILSNSGGTQNGQIGFDIFDDGLGYHIYYKVLNTRDFGIPQNRERIFIVGFKDFREFSFPKPIELKLRLGDMLQDNPNSKYFLSDKSIKRLERHNNKSYLKDYSACINAGYYKIGRDQQYIDSNKSLDIKSAALRTYPRTKNPNKDRKEGRYKRLELRDDFIANSITTHKDDSLIVKKLKLRRLTPLECWRLQGFRDEDFFSVKDVSDTQLYKQAGNSITVNVLMELFKKIYANYNK